MKQPCPYKGGIKGGKTPVHHAFELKLTPMPSRRVRNTVEQSNHKDSEIATLRERQRRIFRFSTRRYREGSRNDNWAFYITWITLTLRPVATTGSHKGRVGSPTYINH
ncbi:hypothetical protein [Nostoc sp.]|uniref:hypothetical protein n=1 Tax=Nostoc sp. TaxID=1180 RepID=UPI002FF93526